MTDKHLLVVYHSQTGGTQAMLDAVLAGANDPLIENVSIRSATAIAASADDIRWADALILGTPENFGYMSGALKYFFDRIYYEVLEETQGLPYGLFVKAGNDGSGALTSIERIITGLRWREVVPAVLCIGDLTTKHLEQCSELGGTIAAGLEAGLF
ncbi:MAG: NAD(P)H-dependent oxidoreductase [Pseudomonadota bacterium]